MPHCSSEHRILVVDDNPSMVKDFRKILCSDDNGGEATDRTASLLFDGGSTKTIETDSYTVDSATGGREGLERIRQAAAEGNPYALVFVGASMPPGGDGVETAANIWREFSDTQIVICTAHSDYSWEQTVARLGQSDRLFLLKKPFDVFAVRQLVVAITMRAGAEAEAREARETAERLNQAQAEALMNSTKALEALGESEARMRAIVDSASEGIIVIDESGTIESFNPAAERIFGYSAEEVREKNVAVLIPPRVVDEYREAFREFASSREMPLKHASREVLGQCKDGRQVALLLGASEVHLGDRRLFTGLVHDITDRKQAEEQAAMFARFAETSSQGFGMADLRGHVAYVNPALARIIGETDPKRVVGRSVESCYAEEYRDTVSNEVLPAVFEAGQWTGELALRSNDGVVTPTLESIFLIRDEEGQPLCLANVITDISEGKSTERELQGYARALESANKALEEFCDEAEGANRAKGQFLANMSHELRTPLHGVLSFAAFGMKKIETASREDLLGYFLKIERSGKVLLMLVNDLLDLAKLEAGKMTFEFAQVNLRTLVGRVADEFSSTVAHRRITVIRPRPDFDTMLIADSARLMQVVRNLFSNAVKFSPDESTIEVTIEEKPGSFVVSVIDQGIGIPEDELKTVFDKFVQSTKTRSGAGGTGLGLAICEEIISAHRGDIWARNQPQGGAVLSFEIPLNPNDVESVRQDNQSPPGVVLEQPGHDSLPQCLPT